MINKEEFRDILKFIAQVKVSLKSERDKASQVISEIRTLEKELNLRRQNIMQMETMLVQKSDYLFNLVYENLPNGKE